MRRRPWKRKRVKFGRPRLVSLKLQTEALALKERGIAMPEIARRLNLGVSTIYRLLAEQNERAGAPDVAGRPCPSSKCIWRWNRRRPIVEIFRARPVHRGLLRRVRSEYSGLRCM